MEKINWYQKPVLIRVQPNCVMSIKHCCPKEVWPSSGTFKYCWISLKSISDLLKVEPHCRELPCAFFLSKWKGQMINLQGGNRMKLWRTKLSQRPRWEKVSLKVSNQPRPGRCWNGCTLLPLSLLDWMRVVLWTAYGSLLLNQDHRAEWSWGSNHYGLNVQIFRRPLCWKLIPHIAAVKIS